MDFKKLLDDYMTVSYTHLDVYKRQVLYPPYLNVPKGIRTPDPRLRRPLLYPAELWTHKSG